MIVPGSGATSLGAFLSGASRSTCVGSSREGAIAGVYEVDRPNWSVEDLNVDWKSMAATW